MSANSFTAGYNAGLTAALLVQELSKVFRRPKRVMRRLDELIAVVKSPGFPSAQGLKFRAAVLGFESASEALGRALRERNSAPASVTMDRLTPFVATFAEALGEELRGGARA